ncbi:hypothetical protein HYFRA_00000609 [Hymenoscyphus fraxineus]|uniref:Perilipin mpl1-like protein n=1 Tax=Hymenoscyphus fraxineus TaxID=746836 RepID=A0A9N9L144_9HELO|nr:hypothetical protein HYFRA_00000609 [Hymenoscyphus fraxineus]
MPHSESKQSTTLNKMSPQVNGNSAPSSAFLSHLYSYPVVSDSITTFKKNPYGAKSIDLTSQGYEKLGKPIINILAGPYEYVSPYVKKADSIGDHTLSTIDEKFPVVKKPTGELYENAQFLVFFPLKKGSEGKDYVLSTYKGEVKKVGGDGLVAYGTAALGTSIIITRETFNWLSQFLSQKKTQAKEVAQEKSG